MSEVPLHVHVRNLPSDSFQRVREKESERQQARERGREREGERDHYTRRGIEGVSHG